MLTISQQIAAMFANVERTRDDLHPYQRDIAIPFLRDNPFSGLFIDMGMGKSVSSLTVIADLLAEFAGNDAVLVIGPKRVACETWPTEIGLWKHTAHLSYSLIHVGDDDERLEGVPRAARTQVKERLRQEAIRKPADIHIISHDWVEYLVEFWGHKWPYRTVFIDESSSFKNHQSNRFKALAKVRQGKGYITRFHILTATPAAESYEHLFPQIYLLDLGKRLGKNITAYREKYFTYNKWSMKWKLREGCEDEVLALIADITLVMKAKDYLDLAEPTVLRRDVHLGAKELALYKTLQKEFVVTLDDGTEIEAETAAALSSKLLQLSSGVLYETIETFRDDGTVKKTRKVHAIHDKKIEEIEQIVTELDGQPVLIAYHFASSLERLQKLFPKAVVMDEEGACIKAWNAGKIKILLMHPQSGGHGLNLQKGGHHIVFFDIPWSLERYMQFIGRLARQGQLHPVIVWLLTAVGTLDVGVADSLRAKEDGQDKLFAKLKRLIARYRKTKIEKQLVVVDDDL